MSIHNQRGILISNMFYYFMTQTDDILEKYTELNKHFEKTLVFHLGIDAGFFSEYNYMISMILYCLENKVKFKLYSADANFSYDKGWTDFFQPFCEEVNENFHSYCNRHPDYTSWKSVWKKLIYEKDLSLLLWKIKSKFFFIIAHTRCFFNKKRKFDYYTFDLFDKIGKLNRVYNIPELGIKGDYIQAYNRIFDLTWRLNSVVNSNIDNLIEGLDLPESFIACQIRGGDKSIEYNLLPIELYIEEIKKISILRDVFVLTDDFRIISQLRELAPEYCWYTLCQEKEMGYYNSTFAKTEPEVKREQMVRFFASIRIMESATVFLGTITATPSIVIGTRKYPDGYWVDFEKDWFLSTIDLTIAEKRALSEKYLSKNSRTN